MPDRFTCINYIPLNFFFILKSSNLSKSSDIEVNELKSKNLLVLNFSEIEKLVLNFICMVLKMLVQFFLASQDKSRLCVCVISGKCYEVHGFSS